MSHFDDLLDFGDDLPENKSQTAGLVSNTGVGDLLDFGFDSSNGSSPKVITDANIYEFASTEMACDLTNPLCDFDSFKLQKGEKQETSDLMYDFLQNDDTNKHVEDTFTNNGRNEDLLGEYTENVDFLSYSRPVISDDSGITVDNLEETQSREAIEYRGRSESESSESEEQDDYRNIKDIETDYVMKVNKLGDFNENGNTQDDDNDAEKDPNFFRMTHEKKEVCFSEMGTVNKRFEYGSKLPESTPHKVIAKDDIVDGGDFVSTLTTYPDVAKESDQPQEELPEAGMAKNLVNHFKSIQDEKAQPVTSSKKVSSPRDGAQVECQSQPRQSSIHYETKSETAVFESEPRAHEHVIKSGETSEEYQPEKGYAMNLMNKFKEIQTESTKHKAHERREITPDRSGKVEYISELREKHIVYNEAPVEAGVFENMPKEDGDVIRSVDKTEEILPEQGTAKSILLKFKQMESQSGHKSPSSPKQEVTPDRSEFVSEPRGYLEKYEPHSEEEEFESAPAKKAEVIRAEDHTEDILPEVGSTKKTMERFKEIQNKQTSPVNASTSNEFTPPQEFSQARFSSGIIESVARADVVKYVESGPVELPEKGATKNILNRFKEIQSSAPQPVSPGRKLKEFTPLPESGVYENTPKDHLFIETRRSESGIIESTPSSSNGDISREETMTTEQELPEQGMAKNLVSKWKKLESDCSNSKSTSTSSKFKEFTPPRDNRGPVSPMSPSLGVTNGVHPGQFQSKESFHIHDKDIEMKDVYNDTHMETGLPPPNKTASVLQKFKTIQKKAKDEQVSSTPFSKRLYHIVFIR